MGGTPYSTVDGAGSLYLTFGGGEAFGGELHQVNLKTGAVRTVATGLGNLRGVAVAGAYAYVASFDGALQKVDIATGSHTTLASGLQALFGVGRHGNTTYATDGQGELIAVPDGGKARVVSSAVGFSEGIAFSASGLVYTADMGAGNIVETNPATGVSRILASQAYEPTSISVGTDGQVYFLFGDEVIRLNPATGQQTNVRDLEDPGIFEFSLTPGGSTAYAVDQVGGVWRINDVTGQ